MGWRKGRNFLDLSGENIGITKYKELFENFEFESLVSFRECTESNKWFYSIDVNLDKINASSRDIVTSLRNAGIETRSICGLINEQKPYEHETTYKLEKLHIIQSVF